MAETPKRRLTPSEWAKAESLYESGDYSLDRLAEEFGVHAITVQRHMKAHGIEKGSRAAAIKDRVAGRLAEEAETEASVTAKRIRETKEEHYRLNQAIDKRMVREVVRADEEGRSLATSGSLFKSLKLMAETLKITRESRYTVLGIMDDDTRDDELPTLEVRDMTEMEIEEIRSKQRSDAREMGLLEEDDDEESELAEIVELETTKA